MKVAYFSPESKAVQTFDVNLQYFYYNDGDTIYQVDPLLAGVSKKYGKPADYEVDAYPTFLNISPDGTSSGQAIPIWPMKMQEFTGSMWPQENGN